MLHDALTPETAVDSEAAREFMLEATKLATATELEDIGELLEVKSALFGELLAPGAIGDLDEDRFSRLTGSIFSLKRKGKRLLAANGIDTLRDELTALLHGDGGVGERLEHFVGRVAGLERAMILALATESLHFHDPGRHWLWTHWLWNPEKGNGALALVTHDDVDLSAPTLAESYLQVGRATALVNARGHAVGWARSGRGLFGTDIFLASVYAVYMYTVFRVKLSQEFNRILPELPELVRRVLGVQPQGGTDGG